MLVVSWLGRARVGLRLRVGQQASVRMRIGAPGRRERLEGGAAAVSGMADRMRRCRVRSGASERPQRGATARPSGLGR